VTAARPKRVRVSTCRCFQEPNASTPAEKAEIAR
jgi:hypothetical protein